MDLSLNFITNRLNKKSPQTKETNVGAWKDPIITHRLTDNDDLSIATDFKCMYCLNIDSYRHFIRTSIDPSELRHPARKLNQVNLVVPYSPDWASFKRHMYTTHPEQWGYGEVPESYFKIRHSKTAWSKKEKDDVADAYLQIRAKMEYGWNFFVVVKGEIQRTLHALPRDESTITSIEWYARINPLTDKLWTDWRFEKEGETHRRAQNVLPTIIGRTHASITPILRGARINGPMVRKTAYTGHVLEANAKRLERYAHLPLYVNTTCILTDKALQRVQDLRRQCNLVGPGNIGILMMQEDGHQETNHTSINTYIQEKEEKVVDQQVSETQTNIDDSPINVQDVATTLEQLLPENAFTSNLMNQIYEIFDYVREQSQHEEDFYNIQSQLDEANALLKDTRAVVAQVTAEVKKVEAERDEFSEKYHNCQGLLDKSRFEAKALQAQVDKLAKTSPQKPVKDQINDVAAKAKETIRTNRHRRYY